MSRALKQDDLAKLSKLYEAEFNKPDLHDRVLVFDVVASQVEGVSNVDKNETSKSCGHSEDEGDAEKIEISNEESDLNAGDENEAKSQDSKIHTKNANGDQETENTLSAEHQNDDIKNVTNENETVLYDKESIAIQKAQEISETKRKIVVNDVKLHPKTDNVNEIENQQESNTPGDENYANTSLNDTEQNNDLIDENIKTQKPNEIPETIQETVANVVEIHPKTDDMNEIEDQQESNIPTDENYAKTCLNDKEQNEDGSKIFSKGNEATSFPTSKEQVIRQHKFYIHSTWLAVQSSYFRSLFYSGMKESNVKEVHVQILASEEQAHLMLLEAMYKIDVLDDASLGELLDVLKLTHKYDVELVFKKCKYCLQAMVDSLEVCEIIMHFIKVDNTITDVEDLASTLQSFLAQEFSPLDQTWQTASFEELCEPSMRYLLSSDELLAASENTIFHALMHWIQQQGIEHVLKAGGMLSILSVVRFELIPIDYLYNIVQHHSVARKFPAFNHLYLRGISYHALSNNMKKKMLRQPVKRKPSTELLLAHTWVIPRNKLDNLVGTDKRLLSDRFWFCGYTMVLGIQNIVEVYDNYEQNKDFFQATLFLAILSLTQQSEVMIDWEATSQSFTKIPQTKLHTFEKEKQLAFVDLKYSVEIYQSALNSKVTTGTGFKPGPLPLGSSRDRSITQLFGNIAPSFDSTASQCTDGKSASISKLLGETIPSLSIDVKMKLELAWDYRFR